MRPTRLSLPSVCVALLVSATAALADNGSYSGSGGSFSTGTAAGQSISVQGVALSGLNATASFTCPISTYGAGTYQLTWSCAGGAMTIVSADGSLSMNGSFMSGSMTFSGGGGGKGGHVTYWYAFSGKFTGAVTIAGQSQRVLGSISTEVKTTAQIGAGSAPLYSLSMGWSSAYSPVVVADAVNGRLIAADNITGTNLVTYGSYGSGTGQFSSISGLAQDAAGRIYVADSLLNRIARIDDLTGKNWTELGSSGSGNLNFSAPLGVAIDAQGKIWVADSGNDRIVRFDDMTGANWTAFGSAGSGAGQFSAPSAIAFDAQGRIYVADSGNNRLVRSDDLSGTNWTTLSQINIDPYGYLLNGVNAVAVTSTGRIFAGTPAGWLYRIDDMTGANGQAASWTPSVSGMSLDAAGTIYLAGGFSPPLAQTLDAVGTGHYLSSLGLTGLQPTVLLALAVPSPRPAAPRLSVAALSFPSRNVGEPGATQTLSVTNIGGQPLAISSLTATPDFLLANGCSAPLAGGSTCTIGVRFDPTATGPRAASLQIESNGAHPLLSVALSGTGTAPAVSILPGALTFGAQALSTSSGAESLTLANPGTGPLTISSIVASGDFSATWNCPSVLAPGAGCTIGAVFTPTAAGARTGSLTIADDLTAAGSQQTVSLSGVGSSTTPALSLSPESLLFPPQQVNIASAAQSVTLHNSSSAAVALGTPAFPAGFTGSTTCGKSLAAGASCTVSVQFHPGTAGAFTGRLTIPVTGGASLALGLAGAGVLSGGSPSLSMNPNPVSFGMLVVGDNPSINMTVANPTGMPVGIRSIARTGSSAYSITRNNCPKILNGGASCTVQVTFIPPAIGTYSGTLTITESSGAATPVALAGSAGTDNGN